MTNPKWPQFMGVPNMTVDDKGRPSVLDLVPGKQEGTPLNQALINPIIHTLCDVSDAQSGYLPLSGGDITGSLTIQGKSVATSEDIAAETRRAKSIEAGLLPLSGGTLSGKLSVGGQFSQNGETLSNPLGTQVGTGRFYMQAVQPDNVSHITGRLLINDLDGTYYKVLEATTDGTLKNVRGKALATVDDVQAEATRARNAEDGLLPVSGGTLSGALLVGGAFAQKGETLSQTLGAQVGNGQFYLQAIQPDGSNHITGRLVIKDLDGNFYRVLEATTDGTLKNAGGETLATTNDVQAEAARAKAAEAGKLDLAGGTVGGSVKFNSKLSAYSGEIVQEGTYLTLKQSNGDGSSGEVRLYSNGVLQNGSGNRYSEIITQGVGDGRLVTQIFTFVTPNGDQTNIWVPFPYSFKETPILIQTSVNVEFYDQAAPNWKGRNVMIANKTGVSSMQRDITKDGVMIYGVSIDSASTWSKVAGEYVLTVTGIM